MRRLISLVAEHRIDLTSLITHRFALDDILEAYDLFSRQGDGVLKVALFPAAIPDHPRSVTTDWVEPVVPA
jgi:threonine dehydrogenase-like Zn-dependent dehydrogenase